MAKKFLTGLKLVNLSSDPASGEEGELYFNTSASVAKIYKQGVWSELGSGAGGGSTITVSTTAPVSPSEGDEWYKNDTGELYIWDGAYWVEINGTISASGALTNIDSIVYPDYITFDTSPETVPTAQGSIYWDSGDGLPKTVLNANVELGIGQEQVALVKNATGSTIDKGKVVYINGAAGQRPTVALSDADTEPTSSKTLGLTAESIADGAEGFITTFGVLRGVNTDGLTEGSALWLSSTPGGYQTAIPEEPAHMVFVGYVVKAHASSGEIFVNPQNGYELTELHGVTISSASVQQGLVLDSDGVWKNQYIVNSIDGTTNQIDVSSSGITDVVLSLPNELITPGNLTVTGNLTVSGSTTYINTQTLNIEDNIITLNSNVTGTPTGTAGIEVERGTETNTSILWNEDTQSWEFSNDIKTAIVRNNNTFQIDVSASAGYSGEIDFTTSFAELNINTNGSIDIKPGDISGMNTYQFTKTYLQFPDLSQQTTAFLGMSNYDTGDLSEGTNLYFTNERAVSALSSTLADYLTNVSASNTYLKIVDASNTYLTQVNASTTYQPIGSYLTSETDPVFIASEAYNITSGDTANWDTAYGWGNHAGAGYLTSAVTSLSGTTNQINASSSTGAVTISLPNTVYLGASGNKGALILGNVPSVDAARFAVDNLNNTFIESKYGTVLLIPASGYEAYVGTSASTNIISTHGWVESQGYLTSYTETDTLENVTDRGATSSNAITISNATQSTSPTSGALIISGGVGIAKDVWIDGDLHVNGTTVTENTQTVATHDNLIYLNAALDSTITNAVYASGSITYTADNMYTAGMDIRVTGVDPSGFNISSGDNLTVASATPTYFIVVKSDPGASYVSGGTAHAKNEANPDLGFAGGYYQGGYAHAGLFRDSTDGVFKFFDGYTLEPDESVNIDTTHASFSLAPILVSDATIKGALDIYNSSGTNLLTINTGVVDTISSTSDINITSGSATPSGIQLTSSMAGISHYANPTGETAIQVVDGQINFLIGLTVGAAIDSSGNLGGLAWAGNTIDEIYGGTGQATYAAGDILYASATDTLSKLSATTDGYVLTLASGVPTWAAASGGGGGLSTTTTSITTNSATVIESFATATSRTAEAIIQITQGTDYYSSKVLFIHDGTNVKITEYAILESTVGAIPLTISAAINGSNVELRATITDAASINATAKVVLIEVAV